MSKILVFGATGYIGVYMVDFLKKNLPFGYEVVAVGRRDLSFFSKDGIDTACVDIRNELDFDNLPTKDIYAIINFTGLVPAYMKSNDPFAYVETNILGSLRIMEYARKCKVDRVLYTQTWADQGGYWGVKEVLSPTLPRKLLYTGDHAFYAITKSMVVDTMEYYKQEFGVKNFVFRLPNIYFYAPIKQYKVDGKDQKIAYRYMIDQAAQGHDIEMWGNPDAFKDVLYVKDLCKMMYLSLFAKLDGGTYNAGTGIKTTLKQQIQGIIDVFSPNPSRARIIEVPDGSSFTSFVMDIDNAKKELGYEPEYTYIRYLEDYKKEQELKRFDVLFNNRTR